jgi:hypothetical protein
MAAYYQLMSSLFVDCNLIREYCNHLQIEADKMQEVSMNATIAAGHTGSHIRTFTEIARQIGTSSARLSGKVQEVRGKTNDIVNATLQAMIRATQLSYFEHAFPGIKGASNIRLVQSRMLEFESSIDRSATGIYRELQTIVSDLRYVEEVQKRVWAVITRLRIEASSMEPSEQVFMASIADFLSESSERAGTSFTHLFETVRQFERKLVASKDGGKGARNAS